MCSAGHEITVLTTNTNGAQVLPPEFRGWRDLDGYRVFYANRWLWRDLSPALARELRRQVPACDVVHATGTYNWFLPLVARWCARAGKPLVVSPRGSLVPEARSSKAAKKRLFDWLAQGRALARVSAFHATSEAEAEAIRDLVPGAVVVVIPNGVDVPEPLPERQEDAPPYVLYIGRLHPYKRVGRIIQAFARAVGKGGDGCRMTDDRKEKASVVGGRWSVGKDVEGRQSVVGEENGRWSLIIAGGGGANYRRELERAASEAGIADRVRFVGHVSGEAKTKLLAQAGFVVQAPNPENFGNVVAEALAHGTTVLVGRGLPWEALDREGCGFWVDDADKVLAESMVRLMALPPEERRAMGQRGREWMKRNFSWDGVAKRMIGLYEKVIEEKKSAVGGR